MATRDTKKIPSIMINELSHMDHILLLNPQLEARDALRELLEKISLLVLTLGCIATVASLIRITSQGWHPGIISPIISFLAVVVVILLRRRIPLTVVMACLLGITGLSTIANFLTLGLATISMVMLVTICVIAGAVFSLRIGVAVLITSVIAITGVGSAVIFGKVPGAYLPVEYLRTPQAWITQISGYILFTVILLVTFESIKNRFSTSFQKVIHQAEEIKDREMKYRLLADNMRDVLFIQDMDLNIVYASPSAEKVLGYSLEELMQLKMEDYITPESLKRAFETFGQYVSLAQKGEVEVPLLEFEYIRKDGTTFRGELKASFIRDSKGQLVGTQGILRDITDRKRAEEERKELEQRLRQSEKLQAIGELAGGVAHDFNNQLTGIMGFADMFKQMYPNDERIKSYADNILTPASRAADLTNKLLAFARKGAFEEAPVDMHKIIEEVIAILEHSIDKTITLVRHYEAIHAVVIGDATQLENAILNIALNARDAMPKGGQITFTTRVIEKNNIQIDRLDSENHVNEYLEIAITDTGIGIDEGNRDRIFEPFFTTKEKGQGSGMGLPAVYGTIKGHCGSIDVESEKGSGATFIIHLPLCKSGKEVVQAQMPSEPSKGTGGILVIDDEDAVRYTVKAMLKNLGYDIKAFSDGHKAIEFYNDSTQNIDLVILDLILPVMNGKEVFKELQNINKEVKVLLISGYTIDDEVRKLIKKGAAGFLKKPFTTLDLSKKIAGILGARKNVTGNVKSVES